MSGEISLMVKNPAFNFAVLVNSRIKTEVAKELPNKDIFVVEAN